VKGKPFARYRLRELLGRSGFSELWFARPNHELTWPR
jgi:hypothetical protein